MEIIIQLVKWGFNMDLYYISWPSDWLKYFGYEQTFECEGNNCSISLRKIEDIKGD